MCLVLEDKHGFDLPSIKARFSLFGEKTDLPKCDISFEKPVAGQAVMGNFLDRLGDFRFYCGMTSEIIVSDSISVAVVETADRLIHIYLPSKPVYNEMKLSFLMLQAYRYILAHDGQFQMHSAVVVKNGVGIAFCGLPGAGKSTQAHLWMEHLDAEPLNLDQPIVLFDEKQVMISGSPWSGKEDCYKTDIVPLKAIFFVEKAEENFVTRLSVAEGFSHLYLHNYLVPVNSEIEDKHFQAVQKVATNVPIYRLNCTISKQAVDVAYQAVFEDSIKKGYLT